MFYSDVSGNSLSEALSDPGRIEEQLYRTWKSEGIVMDVR